jgi:Helix-loop-helix DNA-binding domain
MFVQIKKPLIEKRRRERINECLVQLKALVLEAMNKDVSISCNIPKTFVSLSTDLSSFKLSLASAFIKVFG